MSNILPYGNKEESLIEVKRLRYQYVPTLEILELARERLACYPGRWNLDYIKIPVELQTEESYNAGWMTDRFCLVRVFIKFHKFVESNGAISWIYIGPVKVSNDSYPTPKLLKKPPIKLTKQIE